jgi:hypothetical protein
VDVANASQPARRNVVYVNFEVRTNAAVRVPLLQRLEGLPVAWRAPPRPFADYLADMAGCRWAVSPPGNGVDCHRTWEALYLGITPIVLKTASGAGLHDGLPIIQLPDLAVLDAPGLEEAERALADRAKTEDRNPVERIKMSYWRERIARAVMEAGR